MGKGQGVLYFVPSAYNRKNKNTLKISFVHYQLKSPDIDWAPISTVGDKMINKKKPLPSTNLKSREEDMYMKKSGRQYSSWRVAQNTGRIERREQLQWLKLSCDSVPGQQTGTIFLRAMLKHIMSASIRLPSLTVSLVETTRPIWTQRARTQGGRREEMVGRTGGGKHYLIHKNKSIHASYFIQEALLRKN